MEAKEYILGVDKLPVMKTHCATCPFRLDENGFWRDRDLANKVISRTLFKAQQICHGTEVGEGRTPQHRCRGAWEHNNTVYERLGFGSLPEEGAK